MYTEPPAEYETIGLVEASCPVSAEGLSEKRQTALEMAVEELKNQAASIGASGIILQHIGQDSKSSGYYSGGVYYTDSEEIKKVSGKAIYIHQE